MNLSALVAYRNLLKDYTPDGMHDVVKHHAGHSLYLVKENALQLHPWSDQMQSDYNNIVQAFDTYNDTIQQIQTQLQQLIDAQEPSYFKQSTELYKEKLVNDVARTIITRRLNLLPDAKELVEARIKPHSDWRYPGLIIRPGIEKWINHLVALDPMYLVDHQMDLLTPTLNRFHDQYKNRLRTYLISDDSDKPLLDALPNHLFSFCLVYNFFNYKPIEVVKRYLQEIYKKIKPGGSMSFTFNNCDRPGAIELVEQTFMCYTPGRLILPICKDIGFEIGQVAQLNAECDWVELHKPGELTSLRGGQNMAKIVPIKSKYMVELRERAIDLMLKKLYTKKEIHKDYTADQIRYIRDVAVGAELITEADVGTTYKLYEIEYLIDIFNQLKGNT